MITLKLTIEDRNFKFYLQVSFTEYFEKGVLKCEYVTQVKVNAHFTEYFNNDS